MSTASTRASNRADPSTLSNYLDVLVTAMHLDLDVRFDDKVIVGTVKFKAVVQPGKTASSLALDTRGIKITRVEVEGEHARGGQRRRESDLGTIGADTVYSDDESIDALFNGEEEAQPLGRALWIPLGREFAEGEEATCSVSYSTTSESSAVQFLEASQTEDKVAPFLFTQSQAIHARSLLPCQDTPGAKSPYTATVKVPSKLTAVMSALSTGKHEESDHTVFRFDQPVPVPSYLIALAAGSLEQRAIAGESTMSVWAEPSIVDKAAAEFVETPAFVRAGEALMGPYEWTRYDLLVLPPTFPYGGMENPCLTFVTPTLLAGDKSLADVIAHEICHSWAGNLVTCATWEHFWLNEGATMMAQRFIVGRVSEESSSAHWGDLRGMNNFQFDAAGGTLSVNEDIEQYMKRKQGSFTLLVPDMSGGIDPDDTFSRVPYEKGFLLFDSIRRAVGDLDRFKAWFKAWFQDHRRTSVTSEDLRRHVTAWFASPKDGKAIDLDSAIDWSRWFFTEGAAPDSDRAWEDGGLREACIKMAGDWMREGDKAGGNMDSWAAGQKICFLDQLVVRVRGESCASGSRGQSQEEWCRRGTEEGAKVERCHAQGDGCSIPLQRVNELRGELHSVTKEREGNADTSFH
jgi:aminopeptidase N